MVVASANVAQYSFRGLEFLKTFIKIIYWLNLCMLNDRWLGCFIKDFSCSASNFHGSCQYRCFSM